MIYSAISVEVLLIEEIHPPCMKPCKKWDIYHINRCRNSSINSSTTKVAIVGASLSFWNRQITNFVHSETWFFLRNRHFKIHPHLFSLVCHSIKMWEFSSIQVYKKYPPPPMLCFNGSYTTWKGATVATPMSWWKSCCTLLFATFFLSGEFIDPFTTVYNTGNSPWHLGDFTSIPH